MELLISISFIFIVTLTPSQESVTASTFSLSDSSPIVESSIKITSLSLLLVEFINCCTSTSSPLLINDIIYYRNYYLVLYISSTYEVLFDPDLLFLARGSSVRLTGEQEFLFLKLSSLSILLDSR